MVYLYLEAIGIDAPRASQNAHRSSSILSGISWNPSARTTNSSPVPISGTLGTLLLVTLCAFGLPVCTKINSIACMLGRRNGTLLPTPRSSLSAQPSMLGMQELHHGILGLHAHKWCCKRSLPHRRWAGRVSRFPLTAAQRNWARTHSTNR